MNLPVKTTTELAESEGNASSSRSDVGPSSGIPLWSRQTNVLMHFGFSETPAQPSKSFNMPLLFGSALVTAKTWTSKQQIQLHLFVIWKITSTFSVTRLYHEVRALRGKTSAQLCHFNITVKNGSSLALIFIMYYHLVSDCVSRERAIMLPVF